MKILITAGGTREYIDPVRFISNASSGRMGYAIAQEAIKAGHEVTIITAPVSIKAPKDAKVVDVESAMQMYQAVKDNFAACDCLIMAAAVSDYTPAKCSKTKIKKNNAEMEIKLKPTKDILAWAGKNKKHQLVVGFALEDKNLKANAEAKLTNKKLDMIIANAPAAIGADTSTIYIKTPTADWFEIANKSKQSIAKIIVSKINQCS